jgi:hypothetical protein
MKTLALKSPEFYLLCVSVFLVVVIANSMVTATTPPGKVFEYVSRSDETIDSRGRLTLTLRDPSGLLSRRSRRDLNLLDKMKQSETVANVVESSSRQALSSRARNLTTQSMPDTSVSLCTYASINARVNECFQKHTNCR